MQANGAEMLRLACCLATEEGIRVVAPVHDAVLIEAPVDGLDAETARMQECMRQASAAVLDGFELRADSVTFVHPARYVDERGSVMWKTVNSLLAEIRTAVLVCSTSRKWPTGGPRPRKRYPRNTSR